MPRFDQRCLTCGWTGEVVTQPFEHPPCPECHGATERYYPIGGTTNGVIGDEFIGGKWIENLGHQPVFIESRSQLKREMEARGLQPMVRHRPLQGSDKSPHTTRWV